MSQLFYLLVELTQFADNLVCLLLDVCGFVSDLDRLFWLGAHFSLFRRGSGR